MVKGLTNRTVLRTGDMIFSIVVETWLDDQKVGETNVATVGHLGTFQGSGSIAMTPGKSGYVAFLENKDNLLELWRGNITYREYVARLKYSAPPIVGGVHGSSSPSKTKCPECGDILNLNGTCPKDPNREDLLLLHVKRTSKEG